MDVRASDAERDATVERLREAAAEGRLTFEELADRIEAAAGATTRGELVRLTGDLPTALAPSEPIRVRTLGDVKRSGAWVVPAELRLRSWLGHITLDLREATISAQEIHIHARTPFGNIDLLVPEGFEVDVRARGSQKLEGVAPTPGSPRIVLTGGTMFGTVKVRHKRLWEKLLKGGR
jgi:hypothetical protein